MVEIPADVLSQIEEMRRMGIADLTDSYAMTRLAFQMDLADAFFWIARHREEYVEWANGALTP